MPSPKRPKNTSFMVPTKNYQEYVICKVNTPKKPKCAINIVTTPKESKCAIERVHSTKESAMPFMWCLPQKGNLHFMLYLPKRDKMASIYCILHNYQNVL